MKFRIPFTFASLDKLKKRSAFFKKFIKERAGAKIKNYLENSGEEIDREEYLSICAAGFFLSLVVVFILASTVLVFLRVNYAILLALGLSFLISLFVFFSRLMYPKVYDTRKQRDIDKNLIPALQDMLVQLNSGIP